MIKNMLLRPVASFLGATKHLYNWLCPLVCLSVCLSVTHSFDDPHVAPYWPSWPCFPLPFLNTFLLKLLEAGLGCLRMTSYRPLELAAVFYMGHGVYKWENIIGGHSRAPLS